MLFSLGHKHMQSVKFPLIVLLVVLHVICWNVYHVPFHKKWNRDLLT